MAYAAEWTAFLVLIDKQVTNERNTAVLIRQIDLDFRIRPEKAAIFA